MTPPACGADATAAALDDGVPWRRAAVIGAAALAIAYGIALRAFPFVFPAGETDSDEAVVGLMAKHFLRGDIDVFYWGQAYAGTPEVFVNSVFRAVLGDSLFVLRLPNLLYAIAAALLVWLLARELLDGRRAAVATLAFWVTPAMFATYGVREMLFYSPTLVLGLVVCVLAIRATLAPGSVAAWLVIGLCLGLAFWMSANILYFAIPAAVYVVVALRAVPRRSVYVLLGFAIGSWPWWFWNVVHGFATLATARHARIGRPGIVENLEIFVTDGMRIVLGLWTYTHDDTPFRVLAQGLYLAAVVVLLWAGGRALARAVKRPHELPLDVVALAVAPLIYAVLPFREPFAVPRFFFFLWPFAAILTARVATTPRTTAAVAAFLAFTAVYTGTSYARLEAAPPTPSELREVMLERGITRAFADYGIVYRLVFETDERLILSPYQFDRRPAYTAEVRAAPRSAYAFAANAPDQNLVLAYAQEHEIPLTKIDADEYVLYVFERQVYPEHISPIRPLNGFPVAAG